LIAAALVTLREGSDERALRASPPLSCFFLDNGLEVVLSPESSSPTVGVDVFYRAGFRLEPEGRTGFAHLFQNLMFQGTTRVPKPHFGDLIKSTGVLLNGFPRHA
jgi:predicted Zn-dependent peptidase